MRKHPSRLFARVYAYEGEGRGEGERARGPGAGPGVVGVDRSTIGLSVRTHALRRARGRWGGLGVRGGVGDLRRNVALSQEKPDLVNAIVVDFSANEPVPRVAVVRRAAMLKASP